MVHQPAALPPDDDRRVAALTELAILDTPDERAFDDVVALAAALCSAPIALVSLVDRERQWFKACIGLDVRETHRDFAFCAHAILTPDDVLVVNDTSLDARFSQSPLVLGPPHIRFYAGAPIVTLRGEALGTVCVIDTVARTIDAQQVAALQALARQTASLIELREFVRERDDENRQLKARVVSALGDDDQTYRGFRHGQRVAAVGHVTSGITHDFNNLLQALHAGFELIRRKADNADQVRRLAQGGLKTVTRGSDLIAQLLTLSRDEAPAVAPVRVTPHLDSMREFLASAIGPAVDLHFDLAAPAATVVCDRTQFEAAVLNIIVNARDAMNNQGRIDIATRVVELDGDDELAPGTYVELSIADTGPGMAPQVASRVFEPFYTTKDNGKGTGLGLAQVQGFARKSDGAARIDSTLGVGTTVRLYLKTAPEALEGAADNRVAPPPNAQDADAAPSAPVAIKILLVDDDEHVRNNLCELLVDGGYAVHGVESGFEALRAIEHNIPDVVISDVALKGFSGVTLGRVIDEIRPGLPLIFMTGIADLDATRASLGQHAVMLKKPLSLEDVRATIERVVAQ